MTTKTPNAAAKGHRRTLTEEGERILYEIFVGDVLRKGTPGAATRSRAPRSPESDRGGATTRSPRPALRSPSSGSPPPGSAAARRWRI